MSETNGTATLAVPAPLEAEISPLPIPKLADVERVWVLYALQALHGNRREADRKSVV